MLFASSHRNCIRTGIEIACYDAFLSFSVLQWLFVYVSPWMKQEKHFLVLPSLTHRIKPLSVPGLMSMSEYSK